MRWLVGSAALLLIFSTSSSATDKTPFVSPTTYQGVHVSMWEETSLLPDWVKIAPNEKAFGVSLTYDSNQQGAFGTYRRMSMDGIMNCAEKTARLGTFPAFYGADGRLVPAEKAQEEAGKLPPYQYDPPSTVEQGRLSGDIYNYLCK